MFVLWVLLHRQGLSPAGLQLLERRLSARGTVMSLSLGRVKSRSALGVPLGCNKKENIGAYPGPDGVA